MRRRSRAKKNPGEAAESSAREGRFSRDRDDRAAAEGTVARMAAGGLEIWRSRMVSREALSDFGWPACEYLKRTGGWRGGHVAGHDWFIPVFGVGRVAAGDLICTTTQWGCGNLDRPGGSAAATRPCS